MPRDESLDNTQFTSALPVAMTRSKTLETLVKTPGKTLGKVTGKKSVETSVKTSVKTLALTLQQSRAALMSPRPCERSAATHAVMDCRGLRPRRDGQGSK